jgi:polar amino acid transport system substrate-binding protein
LNQKLLRRLAVFTALAFALPIVAIPIGRAAAQTPRVLRWGGDAEGGAPFVEADPANPANVRGFDVEIAGMLARGLGRSPQFVQVAWTSIEQSVERGDFQLGMSGVEDRPALRAAHAVTIPYYEFHEVLAVRTADRDRFRTLGDLGKHRVGTLASTTAYEILATDGAKIGIAAVSYDDDVHPYEDLVSGRLDAVLLDNVIAERSLRKIGGFVIQPMPVATGHYVGVMAKADSLLRDSVNTILRARMRDGSLEKSFRAWNVWNDGEAQYLARAGSDTVATQLNAAQEPTATITTPASGPRGLASLATYAPALLRAAIVTAILSCLSMALAVVVGIVVASGRVYGNLIARGLLGAYVELMRGTPVLLQLFVIYYGLSSVVKLPAFLAAVIGLGLNYGAYESEIYRGALQAVPKSQLEAARTLGLSEFQILRFVRAPQALRLALAPMTNDFVALLKDSSLVSVITVVELTKETAIYATNLGNWVVPGAACAAIYLAMSLPLSRLARRLERRWSAA